MEIGEKIAKLRKEKKLTQLSLSELADVDYNTLRKVETLKTKKPSADFIKKIAVALGISISSFVNEDKPKVEIDGVLPLDKLKWDDFEDLKLMLIKKQSDKFIDVQKYAGRGDKNRDIVAKNAFDNDGKYTLFQLKKYKQINLSTFKNELDGIKKHFFDSKDSGMEIGKIIFCIVTHPSPELRDDVNKYSKEKGLPEAIIEGLYEIDAECKLNQEVLDNYFQWDIKDIKGKVNDINKIVNESDKKQNTLLEQSSDNSKKIDEIYSKLTTVSIEDEADMNKARRLINEGNYNKAKDILLPIVTKVKEAQDKEKLKKVYNNLGVCYTNSTDKEDVNIGLSYYEKALDIDSDFIVTKKNLIGVLINQRISLDKAIKLAKELLDSMYENSEYLGLYLFALCINEEYLEAEKYIEKVDDIVKIIENDENIAMAIPMMYQGLGKYSEAEKYINISLNFFPDSIMLNNAKGNLIMEKIGKGHFLSRDYDIVPFLEDTDDIKKAFQSFSKAYELAKKVNGNNEFLNRLKYNCYQSWILLNKSCRGEKLNFKSEEIDLNLLTENEKNNKLISDFGVALEQEKKEGLSYEIYQKIVSEIDLKYEGIKDFARKFFYNGFPEKTITILDSIYDEAKDRLDIEYWFLLSMSYVLISDDNNAIRLMNEAKILFKQDSEIMSQILRHYSAISFRHHDSTQADRMFESTNELQRLNPDKKILTQIKAIEDNGELTRELKDLLNNISDDYQNKKNTFATSPLPIYTLQKLFSRSFPESIKIPRDNYDFEFLIPYNGFDKLFLETQENNYASTEKFVLDYSVLLNLSKSGQLGLVKLFKKRVLISEELFQQIQHDLLQFEDRPLRDLWNFIRKGEIEIFPFFVTKKKTLFDKVDDFFDNWLTQSISYALENNATFLTDDLRLCNTINGKEIKGKSITSFILFQKALDLGFIDKKQYSSIIGDYADGFNYFLPFNGDDLLNIVSEDETLIRISKINYAKFKKNPELNISRRVYFLLYQVNFPGSDVNSFLVVCNDFIKKMLRLGFTDETKIGWVIFLTNFFSDFVTMEVYIQNPNSIKNAIDFIGRIWGLLLDSSSRDYLIKNRDNIISSIQLETIRSSISKLLDKDL